MIFCGLDTARGYLCVLDVSGQVSVSLRLEQGRWGLRQLHGLLADLGAEACEIVVGVEQQPGPMGEVLAAGGYQVFALASTTAELCRLLRSVVEGSEPSRATVLAGLARTLHAGMQPLTAPTSMAAVAREYRRLVQASRYEQQRLTALLSRRSGDRVWPIAGRRDQLGPLERRIRALPRGPRFGGRRVGSRLAALSDLELRLGEVEHQLFEVLRRQPDGGCEGWWEGDEEDAGSFGPSVGASRLRGGRVEVAVLVLGLSLALAASEPQPSTPAGAGGSRPRTPGPLVPELDAGTRLDFSWPSAPPVAMPAVARAAARRPTDAGQLRPGRLEIPAVDLVTPPLVDLGLDAEGGLEVPTEFGLAGWYTDSAVPGSPGPAVIVGHYDSRHGPAVFYRLAELSRGDQVVVARSDGSRVTFLVERVGRYPKDHFPTEEVYGPTLEPSLRLITCGGRFDRATGRYDDNVVVFAHQSSR